MNDKKAKAREILDREEHKKPRPGTRDHEKDDVPDLNHPDQRGDREPRP